MQHPTHRATWYPVLGTQLWLSYLGDPAVSSHVESAVLAAFDRGDQLLSTYRPDSTFNRWRHGDLDQPPDDVVAVLAQTHAWWLRSEGALNPDVGDLLTWQAGERRPGDGDLAARVERLTQGPGFRVEAGHVYRDRDCSQVTCDAVAKGWIIDSAVVAALAVPGVDGVSVVCGGDLRHAGAGSERVRIEDPEAPVDNAPGLVTIDVSNAALATSANTRRGATVNGQWRGHVIDPRTGSPVTEHRQASVLAADAVTADAAATAALVLGAERTPAVLAGLEWLLIDADSWVHSAGFPMDTTATRPVNRPDPTSQPDRC